MKKTILTVLVLFLGFTLVACGPKAREYALVTDEGTISDQSFNQAAWTGLEKFATENKLTYHYYEPKSAGGGALQASDRMDAIDRAVKGGAKVVVLPGFLFADILDDAADKYSEVKFIGVDVTSKEPKDNVKGIFFKDYEAGYLAGYAIVKEGKEKIGFMGGMPVPAVVEYGTGYIAGALQAASEMDKNNFVFADDRFTYLDSFGPNDEIKSKALSWYNGGLDVIFACAGGAGLSVHSAALDAKKLMIGVDVDQGYLSEHVITSAMKNMGEAVYEELNAIKNGTFKGGNVTKGVKEDGSGIATADESWRFKNFNKADYDAIVKKIKDGEIVVPQTYEQLVEYADALGFAAGTYPQATTVAGGEAK